MEIVHEICEAIAILFKNRNRDGFSEENLHSVFTKSICSVRDRVINCFNLSSAIGQCAPRLLDAADNYDVEWRFVEWCLVLLYVLGQNLKNLKDSFATTFNHPDTVPFPQDTLSVVQQKNVLTCVQAIVAVGIYPSLIPGVGIALEKRLGYKEFVVTRKLNFIQQHRHLVACITVLLRTLNFSSSLSTIILTRHLGDLLVPLIQLCHAPIKKESKGLSMIGNRPSDLADIASTDNNIPSCSKCVTLEDMFLLSEDSSENELDLITEMWEDRHCLISQFEKLRSDVYQPLLVRELLIIQNSCSKRRGHSWFQKACGFMLTSCLIRDGGVKAVFEGILDSDLASSEGEWKKYEAVAKVIAYAPLQSLSLKDYYRNICKQVLELLKMESLLKQSAQLRVVCTIVVHLSLNQPGLTAEFLIIPALKPFLRCCENLPISHEEKILSSEDEVKESIDILHKVFVLGVEPTSSMLHELRQAYFPLFFFLLETQGSVFYLRSSVVRLLVLLLEHNENPVELLLGAAFGRNMEPLKHVVSGIHFKPGSKGGIQLMLTRQPVYEDCLVEDSHKTAVILELMKELNMEISVKFFLSLLEQLASVAGESDSVNQPNLYSENNFLEIRNTSDEMTNQLRHNLLLLSLLQELSDVVKDSLLDDRAQAVSFVKASLERGVQLLDTDSSIQTETLIMSLGVLSMFVSQKHQLKANDWQVLSTVLPVLSELSSNSFGVQISEMAEELMITIATRGTGNLSKKTASNTSTLFQKALLDVKSPIIPEQGHGLISLRKLLRSRDVETIGEKEWVLKVLQEKLDSSDSYVYLIAIQALVALANIDPSSVLTVLSEKFVDEQAHEVELRMKIGETLMQICRNLGALAAKHKNLLLNTFLHGTKDKDELIRASSLSNLGELCNRLRFSLGSCVQELLLCLRSVLQSDPSVQARRAAVMVTTLLLKGLGRDIFQVLQKDVRDLYRQLKLTYETDKDDVVRLHAQLSLEEVNSIMLGIFTPEKSLTKKINVLDPL